MADTRDAGDPQPVDPADPAQSAIVAYAAGHDDLVLAGAEAVQLVTSVLDEAGINYLTVSGRTKSVGSFAEKVTRSSAGVRLYTDPLREIGDQLGVRVITYVRADVDAVADLLADQVVVTDDRDLGRETASEGRFGYASRHLQIMLDAAREGQPAYAHLAGRNVQVQIRTVLQHAWAEFEHDIRYKGTVPLEHASDFDRRFTLAAGLLELADQEFATIRDRLRGPVASDDHLPAAAPDDDPRLDAREIAAFLAGQYADAGWSRSDHYVWVSGLLLELGITSLDELGDVLRATDEESIHDRMDYRYPPGAVRRLDDALLATYGERYVALHGNSHRVAALRARLDKLGAGDT
jgi:ppGpp synthetase/RelA/SpoT-type nucleotidyltranferase